MSTVEHDLTGVRYGDMDFRSIWRDFPPAPEYLHTAARFSADEIRALQEVRFQQQMARGWQIAFYRRHWRNAGLEPGDIRSLDDITKVPIFSIYDLRDSYRNNPPWGDLIGIDPETSPPTPLFFQTSGGTTGVPRPMMYTGRDREIMNLITGRRMYMQGVRPFDIVQIALATGLPNAGFLLRESIVGYTGAVPIMTGTGAQTPTRRQIELMREWKVNFFAALAPYARHVARVAREELDFDVHDLKLKGILSWLGPDSRQVLEEEWGAPVYDNYGTNELGTIASDCEYRSGLHVFEDAFYPELLDQTLSAPVAGEEKGVLLVTALFKHAAPMIRFNTNDVFQWLPGGCACGATGRRLSQFQGRADNMVKFRATNIFPEAIGALLGEEPAAAGEYVCYVPGPDAAGHETFVVMVECQEGHPDRDLLTTRFPRRLKEALGATLDVQLFRPGELAPYTLIESQTKPRRVIKTLEKA